MTFLLHFAYMTCKLK